MIPQGRDLHGLKGQLWDSIGCGGRDGRWVGERVLGRIQALAKTMIEQGGGVPTCSSHQLETPKEGGCLAVDPILLQQWHIPAAAITECRQAQAGGLVAMRNRGASPSLAGGGEVGGVVEGKAEEG